MARPRTSVGSARVQAALVCLAGLVGAGCYHAHLALPADFVSGTPAHRVRATGPVGTRAQFGPYRITQDAEAAPRRKARVGAAVPLWPLRFQVEDTRSGQSLSAVCSAGPMALASEEGQEEAGLRCSFHAGGEGAAAEVALLAVPEKPPFTAVVGRLEVGEARYEVRSNARLAGQWADFSYPVGYELWREGRLVGAVQSWSGGPVWLDTSRPAEEGLVLAAACAGLLGQRRAQQGQWGQTALLMFGEDKGPALRHAPGEAPERMRVSATLQVGGHFLVSAQGPPPRDMPLYVGVVGTYWVLDMLGLQVEVGHLRGPGDTLSVAGLHAQLPLVADTLRLSIIVEGGLLRSGSGGASGVFSPGAGLTWRASESLWLGASVFADQVQELGGRVRTLGSVGWAF